jgi:hypothetical protein
MNERADKTRSPGSAMAIDHITNLTKVREILRKRRRKLIATLATAKREPTKFDRLVELQQVCDAVEWALEDEAAAAKEHDSDES